MFHSYTWLLIKLLWLRYVYILNNSFFLKNTRTGIHVISSIEQTSNKCIVSMII
jgi:hypothetical protein